MWLVERPSSMDTLSNSLIDIDLDYRIHRSSLNITQDVGDNITDMLNKDQNDHLEFCSHR